MVINRSAPRATVVPVLVYDDVAKAIDWLCDAFGFKERLSAALPDGSVTHAQLAMAEGAVMVGRQGGEFRPPRPDEVSQYVVVHVEDVDGHFERARQCGARILRSPTDMPFGERQYTVEDPWGHRWTFSQSIADVDPEAWGACQNDGGMAPEHVKSQFDELVSHLWKARKELESLTLSLTRPDDLRAAESILTDLAWAVENCTVIGLHQIGRALEDDMGHGDVP